MKNNIYSRIMIFGLIIILLITSLTPSIYANIQKNKGLLDFYLIDSKSEFQFDIQKNYEVINNNPPDEQWNATFGGYYGDLGRSVYQTSDGCFITTGKTDSYDCGYDDAWLIKVDASGNELWNYTYGSEFEGEIGYYVQEIDDGGYVIIGSTINIHGPYNDGLLIKVDYDGNELWSRTYGGPEVDRILSGQQTNDGGYILAGSTNSYGGDMGAGWLIKTDCEGYELWNKTFDNFDFSSVKQTSDDGYILTGSMSCLYYGRDVIIIKTDSNGDKVWEIIFDDLDTFSYGFSVQQTFDEGYLVIGSSFTNFNSSEFSCKAFIIKIDSNGNLEWNKTYQRDFWDWGYSGQQTIDGGYIVVGCSNPPGNDTNDVWLFRTDSNGNLIWNITFGGLGHDVGYSVIQSSDGGYIITGITGSFGAGMDDLWLIKVKSDIKLNDAFIFGRLSRLNVEDNFINFNSENIRLISFNPFSFNRYSNGDMLAISKDYKGFVGERYIFAICKYIT